MSRPKLLDLYSCQGGAAMGYHQAGFTVYGIDKEAQPRYPFAFHQGDAIEALTALLAGEAIDFMHPDGSVEWLRLNDFAAIHASPPCQRYAGVTAWRGDPDDHPDLLPATRQLLATMSVPWVIENVPEAPIRPDYLLCGTMFGLKIRRHRAFETSWGGSLQPSCGPHRGLVPFMHKDERAFADALGGTWMSNRGGREAIPPAFTQWIGEQLMAQLGERAA